MKLVFLFCYVQVLTDYWIQNSRLYSKTKFLFYRLKVNKQVINREWVGGGVKHKSLVLSTEVIK